MNTCARAAAKDKKYLRNRLEGYRTLGGGADLPPKVGLRTGDAELAILSRMRRWILYFSACISGLCLLAVLIAWPWSHFRWVHLEYKKLSNTSYSVNAHSGRVQFSYARSEVSAWPVGMSFNVYPIDI